MKKGWQKKRLGELCQIRPPKSEARDKVTPNAIVSFAPMEDLGIDRKYLNPTQQKPLACVDGSYTYFADGDVLLAKITPCFENGKLGIATGLSNGVGFGSSEFIVFRPCATLDKEYLYYCLSHPDFRSEGAARMGGAVGQQRVPREFIESYPIPLPPLPEQRRIVGILDEAFEGIATAKANAEKNLQNARALFESHLNAVFTQRGEGWLEKRLEDVCSFSSGGTPSKKNSSYWNGDIPWVSGRDMKSTRLSDAALHISQKAVDESSTRMAPAGALLTLVRGMGLAHGAQIAELMVPCAFNQDIRSMQPERDLIPRYLLFALRTRIDLSENVLSNAAHGTLKIDMDELKNVRVPIPSPEHQHRIVLRINALSEASQRLASLYEQKLAALDELKKSLLHQAFSGQL
jgi:type I restriction enzyme S subunit